MGTKLTRRQGERGANAASDHHLVVAVVRTKLKAYKDHAGRPAHKFNVNTVKELVKAEEFRTELRNKFSVLANLQEDIMEEQWSSLRDV